MSSQSQLQASSGQSEALIGHSEIAAFAEESVNLKREYVVLPC